jgi:hypothetical protein
MENCIEAVRFPPWQIEILHCMQDNKQETSGPSNNNNKKKNMPVIIIMKKNWYYGSFAIVRWNGGLN